MAYKAIDIANKLLLMATENDAGELMSNMKLQKMLYYEQGFHLAAFGTPLFDEPVEAWMYGPAVPTVYEHFKGCGAAGIEPETDEPVALTLEEEELFGAVFDAYAGFSAIGLMDKTHGEMPWKSTPAGRGNVISHDKMREFFKTQIS